LNPQIGFDLFKSIEEPENRDVTSCEVAISFLVLAKGGEPAADTACAHSRCACRKSVFQKRAPICRFIDQGFDL
jgi:hypothetical protein